MANKLPVLNEAKQGISEIQNQIISLGNEIKTLDNSIVSISKRFRELPKNNFDIKTPREANIPLQKRADLMQELGEKQSKLETANRKLATSLERLKNARTQGNKKTSEEIVNNRLLARNADRAAKANSKLLSIYERLVSNMNNAGRSVQNLNAKRAQGIKLSKSEQRELNSSTARFNRYKKAVDVADKSIGRFQRNVGNYGKALGGLAKTFRSLVGALGAASGVYAFVSIMRSGVNIVRDFGASMANLAGIFRVTRDDLAPLEADIIAVAGASVKTATEVAKLAESLATLGKSKEEISDLLEPVNNLSIGLGATSDETAEFLVQTLNAFGASSDEALKYADTIATIRTSTSLNFQRMRDSFQYLTPISQILNKDLAYTGALIGIVADSGIKAERAGRLLGTAQQKLAKEGSTLAQALEQVNDAAARGVKEEKLLAIASNLFGKQAASLGIILAQNSDIIETNAQAIRDNGGALDDLVNEQLKSLDATLKILKSRWEEYILLNDDATGSSEKLITVIKYLADNIGTIINTIVKFTGVIVLLTAAKRIGKIATIAYSIAQQTLSRSVKTSTASLKLFRIALANTGIGLLVIGVGALFVALRKLNKPLSESVNELSELSDEFIEQQKESKKVNDELKTMTVRHDELKGKANLNTKEQKELNKIIETIGKTVPDAVTEIDRYGNALEINTAKIQQFTEMQKESALSTADKNIRDNTELLEIQKKSLESYSKVFKGVSDQQIDEVGVVRRVGDEYFKVIQSYGRFGKIKEQVIKLTDEEQALYYANQDAIIEQIATLNKTIKANQDVKDSITGVTAKKEAEAAAAAKAEEAKASEVLVVRKLRNELSELQNKLKGLTKNGYNNLTQAQADNIINTRSLISEKKKELQAIIGVNKASKNRGVGKESRGSDYNTKRAELEAAIAFNKEILDNDKSTQAQRILAAKNYYDEQEKLLVLNKKLAIKQAKGNRDKIADIERQYNADTLKNEAQGEAKKLQILEDAFKAKLQLIENTKDKVSDLMQSEIDEQNKIFLESERTPKDIEKRERAILKIEKKYALKRLEVAKAVTVLLAATTQDPKQKAELLEAAAALESSILKLKSDQAIDIAKNEVSELEKIEQLRQSVYRDSAATLADAFGLSIDKINRALDSFKDSADTNGDGVIDKFEKIIQTAEQIGAVTGVIGDITRVVFERNIQQYDEEIQANNDFYAKKLDNENLSEDQRSAIEAERDRKTADLEKKKRDERRKAAIANKAFQAVEIAVDTIKKVAAIKTQVAVLSSNPVTLPFAAAAASLIPLTIATGAVATAAVLAQPIPKYKHGRTDGKAEFAFVGDGGISEIIERASGRYEITPNTDTLTYLNKGDKVHPNADKFIQEQAYNLSLQAQGRTIKQAQPKIDIDTLNKTIKEQTSALMSGLKDNKANVRIHNNNSIGEDLKFLNKLNDEIQ